MTGGNIGLTRESQPLALDETGSFAHDPNIIEARSYLYDNDNGLVVSFGLRDNGLRADIRWLEPSNNRAYTAYDHRATEVYRAMRDDDHETLRKMVMGKWEWQTDPAETCEQTMATFGGVNHRESNQLVTITHIMKEAHATAVSKGWWDEERNFAEQVALQHSELSEVLEEWRDGRNFTDVYYDEKGKPCGIPIEYADLLIRVFDTCQHYGVDLEAALQAKMAYNKTRPHKHGGKRA